MSNKPTKPRATNDHRPRRPRTTHGLTAANPAATRAEKVRFNRFRAAQLQCLDPRDATEAYLAERVIFHRWLLLKSDEAEAAALRDAVWADEHPPARLPDAVVPEVGDLIRSIHESNRPPDGQPLDDHRAVIAFTSRQLENIWRYRTEHERALDRAETRFLHYRKSRILIGLPTDHTPPDPPKPPRRRRTPHVTPRPARTRSPRAPRTPDPPEPRHSRRADPHRLTATPQEVSKPRVSTKSDPPPRAATSLRQTTYSHSLSPTNPRKQPQSAVGAPSFAQRRVGDGKRLGAGDRALRTPCFAEDRAPTTQDGDRH